MSEAETGPEELGGKIRDPEAYVNSRRLKSIFDIRDAMVTVRADVKTAPYRDGSKFEALSKYRALVGSYVVETEPLLRRYEGGPELLHKQEFGHQMLSVREVDQSGYNHESTHTVDVSDDQSIRYDTVRVRGLPDPKAYDLTGLLSIVEYPDPLEAEFELESAQKHKISGTINYTRTAQVAFQHLDRMVRALNNYLGQIGFEVEPMDDTEPAQL